MNKAGILVLGLILIAFSCKKNRGQQAETPQPGPPAANSAPGLREKEIAPEILCQFELDRLRVENETDRKYLSILKAARVHDPRLDSSISRYEQETAARLRELKYKHQMSFQDLTADLQDPAVKSRCKAYLDKHPGIRQEMDDLGQAKKKANLEINIEWERLKQKGPAGPAPTPLRP